MADCRFFIGQLVDHVKFGYRGVVFGVDPVFGMSEEWYEQVAKSRPPKDKPWYQVMVDGASNTTYVAERHLNASENFTQIDHPYLGEFFNGFDGERYLSKNLPH